MGFRLAPREVAPLSSSAGWSPVFVHFGSGSPPLGRVVLKMKMNSLLSQFQQSIFPHWESGLKPSARSRLMGQRRTLPPNRGVCFAEKCSTYFSAILF